MRKIIIIILFLLLLRCTVSLVYVKNSEDIEIEVDQNTTVKDSIGLDLSTDKKNEY
jgi:hypothetical protein